jgi:alanine racemase
VLRGLSTRIDLGAARRNLKRITTAAGNRRVFAVVKADAYGHGAPELSRAFIEEGAEALAVAFVSEARELRDAGIKASILVLFDRTEVPAFFDLGLMPVIHDLKTARAFSKEAISRNTTIRVHVKVDTGMGRMGLEDPSELKEIARLDNIEITGLMSHLSDADLADPSVSRRQSDRLLEASRLIQEGNRRPLLHIANSAAVLSCAEVHLDAVRPGIALYGASPFEDERKEAEELEPVMSATAKVLALRRIPKGGTISYGRTFTAGRDTLAAVVAAGYADGYLRSFSNKACMLVRGKRAPVAGRVCMDLTVADVTDVQGVKEGDDAVLLGAEGSESINARELARIAGTIPYEVLTSLGSAARRAYA